MSSTLLLGLDGMTFRVLDPLMQDKVMPFVSEFCHGGVRADLISTANPMTILAWPSIMTGRNPGAHGCFDFIRSEERSGEMYFTLANGRDVCCETIWSIASRNGKRSTVCNFPLTYPHPAIAGHILPGFMAWKHMRLGVRPAELYDELKALPGFSYKQLAWDFELGNKVADGVSPEEYESWVVHYTSREEQWLTAARHLMKTSPSDLTALLLDGPDKLFHICWRFVDPRYYPSSPSSWEKKIRELCLDYFRVVDAGIEDLVTLAGPEARVFLVSDHGFTASTELFRVNAWLEQKGYLTWRTPPEFASQAERESWERRVNCNFVHLDWDKTKVYAPTSSANGLYIRVARHEGESGVPAREYESFRDRLIEELCEVVNPDTGLPVVLQALKREEVYQGAEVHRAPDLTLVLRDSGFISINNKEPVVQTRKEIWGTHDKFGIFVGRGPGLERGLRSEPLSILDVAPVTLHSLGLEIPRDFEGRVPDEIFERLWISAHPVRFCRDGTGRPAMARTAAAGDAEHDDNAAIMQRLRDLGYIA